MALQSQDWTRWIMWDVLIPAFLLTIFITHYFICAFQRFYTKLPPGPFGLPVLGYAPFLSRAAHKEYTVLHQKYGSVFGYHNGNQYTVVLGDFKTITEAFKKNEFNHRPPGVFKLSEEYQHIAQMNGSDWKEIRTFTLSTIKKIITGDYVQNTIKDEINIVLKYLEERNAKIEVNLNKLFLTAFINSTFFITFGKTIPQGHPIMNVFERFTIDSFESFESTSFCSFPSILKTLIKKFIFNLSKLNLETETYIRKIIEIHDNLLSESSDRNFVDLFLRVVEKRRMEKSSFTKQNLCGNVQALLLAGIDTPRTTLNWMFLCLAFYQEIQDKVYAEVVNAIGQDVAPSWNDRERMPYLIAFIMEVLRVKTPGPASDPHWSSISGTIGGFNIPKGTVLIANLHAVHHDQKLWGDPENFRPERFLSLDGSKVVQPEYFIPFLTGKRKCPGIQLALMQQFLMTSSVVQKFTILPSESGMSLQEQNRSKLYAVKPFLCFEQRK